MILGRLKMLKIYSLNIHAVCCCVPSHCRWFKSEDFYIVMEKKDSNLMPGFKQKILQDYNTFMARVTLFDESVAAVSQFLVGFQQALEFLRRPPVNKKSELVESIIKVNETKRVISYFEAGCVHADEGVQNLNKLRTCLLGLQDYITKAKTIIDELECLLMDFGDAIQTENECLLANGDQDVEAGFGDQATHADEGEIRLLDPQLPKSTDFAAMMAIVYNMIKQDFEMQKRIVSALGLKLSSGELESYSLMWSLRPFVNDELIREAYRLVR